MKAKHMKNKQKNLQLAVIDENVKIELLSATPDIEGFYTVSVTDEDNELCIVIKDKHSTLMLVEKFNEIYRRLNNENLQ